MIRENFVFTDTEGQVIYCNKWQRNSAPSAALLIVHGMAEHSARYDDFAVHLVNSGLIVYAPDLRGHGRTAKTIANTGFLANNKGWEKTTGDIIQLSEIIKKEHTGIPLFLLGHSMGSLIVRNIIAGYPGIADGAILSGTSYTAPILLFFGKSVANIQSFFAGKMHRSRLLNTLSFGKYNGRFMPARTKSDWLTRDEKQVEKYVNDPYCGFICTTSFYSDLFGGILNIQKKKAFRLVNKDLPILIISGEMDAVGDFTKGVIKVFDLYKKHGIKSTEMRIYKGYRHEILNEINRKEVYKDTVKWLLNKI